MDGDRTGQRGLVVAGRGVVAWLTVLALDHGTLIGPRRVIHWFLASWPSRLMILAAWAGAGWHVFCQRP